MALGLNKTHEKTDSIVQFLITVAQFVNYWDPQWGTLDLSNGDDGRFFGLRSWRFCGRSMKTMEAEPRKRSAELPSLPRSSFSRLRRSKIPQNRQLRRVTFLQLGVCITIEVLFLSVSHAKTHLSQQVSRFNF